MKRFAYAIAGVLLGTAIYGGLERREIRIEHEKAVAAAAAAAQASPQAAAPQRTERKEQIRRPVVLRVESASRESGRRFTLGKDKGGIYEGLPKEQVEAIDALSDRLLEHDITMEEYTAELKNVLGEAYPEWEEKAARIGSEFAANYMEVLK